MRYLSFFITRFFILVTFLMATGLFAPLHATPIYTANTSLTLELIGFTYADPNEANVPPPLYSGVGIAFLTPSDTTTTTGVATASSDIEALAPIAPTQALALGSPYHLGTQSVGVSGEVNPAPGAASSYAEAIRDIYIFNTLPTSITLDFQLTMSRSVSATPDTSEETASAFTSFAALASDYTGIVYDADYFLQTFNGGTYGSEPAATGNGNALQFSLELLAIDSSASIRLSTYAQGEASAITPQDPTPGPVPEPSTLLLFGVSLLGISGISRRKDV